MRETSRLTGEEVKADGSAAERRELALATLAQLRQATGRELDYAAGTTGLWKRLSELKAEGRAIECGLRRCGVTNKVALVWRVVTAAEPLLATPKPRRRRWYAVIAFSDEIHSWHDRAAAAFEAASELDERYQAEVVEVRLTRTLSNRSKADSAL